MPVRKVIKNGSLTERNERDYYATGPKAASFLLQLDTFSNVLECAAGGGHLAEVLKEAGLLGRAIDKYDHGYGETQGSFAVKGYKGETKLGWFN